MPGKTTAATTAPIPCASVEECQKELSDAAQIINKVLDELRSLKDAKTSVDNELAKNISLREKEEIYNESLLKAVSLLVSSEKRDKGFFRKLLDQLGKALKAATKPEHLSTIVTLIVLIKKL